MQPQRLESRVGMGTVCLEYSRHRPYEPIRTISQSTFCFHFNNLHYAQGRNDTFLCYEVNRKDCDSLVSLHQGVFKKEGVDHAELCFLYWFYDQVLKVMSPREEFRITWYMSWSPCFVCAEQVARFLATHHNLSLAIFCSRFYYPNYPQKLCSLIQEGAQVAAMDLPEFKTCWNKFVDNGGQPFRPWKRLHKKFKYQDFKLQKILSQISLLREEVFYLQFNNSHWVQPVGNHYYRRKPYLCYQLEQPNGQKPLTGCLLSKKGRQHAEILFLEKVRSMQLSQVRITCYLTWSPCPNCAWQLAAFKMDHPDLILRIYASRLYFHWRRAFQKGLCSLWQSGIQVNVMDLPEFTDCWTNFVNPQRPFMPWNKLEKNSWRSQRRLRRIKESWGLQDLVNDFENLQLGPPLP
ncbi:DNA dC-_dU-editing enzyme APOBEC-3-like isoform X1 [Mastomys coucha]|uniref:DNA dC->dU-editing enzyme APOBEC-3-like isoform X1 n=1 Tax=Mastomys coucha TaxID=35658 RepID=UPI0012618E2E|nr:DNA dC->dU-editing enzyme APOBEC-3-like isoform X1 [Mastomys coucha]XP_031205459.1 DNA dC->dU-editing enzyme APOBEC-3-like isoform X1 [Mastomys coucha]XP_031205467.1 DNA dC->dU-editing enzyme APOBEC-3-like isoform X1 [Mastomys coucha]